MTDSAKARAPILAAGGILLREGSRPRIAVVRLRRDKSWVLPKGKLYPGEQAVAAARREVMEETGHRVSVRRFLGSMSYAVDGNIKIVQFWHMRAVGGPVRELMYDIKAVKWLSLKQAIETLPSSARRIGRCSTSLPLTRGGDLTSRALPDWSLGECPPGLWTAVWARRPLRIGRGLPPRGGAGACARGPR